MLLRIIKFDESEDASVALQANASQRKTAAKAIVGVVSQQISQSSLIGQKSLSIILCQTSNQR
jgi:hypothetical protein